MNAAQFCNITFSAPHKNRDDLATHTCISIDGNLSPACFLTSRLLFLAALKSGAPLSGFLEDALHGRRLRVARGTVPQNLRWGTAKASIPQYLEKLCYGMRGKVRSD